MDEVCCDGRQRLHRDNLEMERDDGKALEMDSSNPTQSNDVNSV
jgi:hypothetical protein